MKKYAITLCALGAMAIGCYAGDPAAEEPQGAVAPPPAAPTNNVDYGANLTVPATTASVRFSLTGDNTKRAGTMRVVQRSGQATTYAIEIVNPSTPSGGATTWQYRQFSNSTVVRQCRMVVAGPYLRIDLCNNVNPRGIWIEALDSGVRQVPSPLPSSVWRPSPCVTAPQTTVGVCILDFCKGSYTQAVECHERYVEVCIDTNGDGVNDMSGKRCYGPGPGPCAIRSCARLPCCDGAVCGGNALCTHAI